MVMIIQRWWWSQQCHPVVVLKPRVGLGYHKMEGESGGGPDEAVVVFLVMPIHAFRKFTVRVDGGGPGEAVVVVVDDEAIVVVVVLLAAAPCGTQRANRNYYVFYFCSATLLYDVNWFCILNINCC
jgi:hypothetical protein